MNRAFIRAYHGLPPSLQSVAASARGLYLRNWRYGSDTEGLIEEALERETWSPTKLTAWQNERLAFILNRAATKVPYYKALWARRRARGDTSPWECIENWPILEKAALRSNPAAFVADDSPLRRMFHEQTSGSTGTPLHLWWSRDAVRGFYALFEARVRLWNGVSRRENWAILGGQPVVAHSRNRPPFWVWNAAMRQLYLSSSHISERNVKAYLQALQQYEITHMVAYSSSVCYLASLAMSHGVMLPIRVVATNAEPLFSWQRDMIRQGLHTEVRETYGMAEITASGSECAHGSLHVWPEVGWIEVLDGDRSPVAAGSSGSFICTSLLNADMPLIRYAVGDRGRLAGAERVCPCGRTLPIITAIEGRDNDLLITRDGRRIFWLNPIFYGIPIKEAQIVQYSIDHVVINYVAAEGFSPIMEQRIADGLKSRMGDIEITFRSLETIPRSANGKFRPIICAIPGMGSRRQSVDE